MRELKIKIQTHKISDMFYTQDIDILDLLNENQKKEDIKTVWAGITDKTGSSNPYSKFLYKNKAKNRFDLSGLKKDDELVIGFKGKSDNRSKFTVKQITTDELTLIDYDTVDLTEWVKNTNGVSA